jgi:DNA-binding MarR family transcriptional regulator
MFGEPAWEILLLLYALGARQTIGRLAELACASKSTTIRWIDYLEAQQLVTRQPHPNDKRAVYAELTDKAREAIRVYLSGTAPTREDFVSKSMLRGSHHGPELIATVACSGVRTMVEGREAGGERRLQLIKVLALLQSALIIIDGLENC